MSTFNTFRSWADVAFLSFSDGVYSQSRLPRTRQRSKRRTVASHSVRSISIPQSIRPSRGKLTLVAKTQPSNGTRTRKGRSGPASMRNVTRRSRTSMRFRTRNSSRPSRSWKTLIRVRSFTAPHLPRSNAIARSHRPRDAGRSRVGMSWGAPRVRGRRRKVGRRR